MTSPSSTNDSISNDMPTFGIPLAITDMMADELLIRIGLDPATIRQRCRADAGLDYAMLAELQLAFLLNVPFDTTMIHISDEDLMSGPSNRPIPMGKGKGVQWGLMDAYHIIVQQRRGGFCFTSNSLFASLLRHLGFETSELAARVNSSRNVDSKLRGCSWACLSHMCLFVKAGDQRYLVDVGFGGGASHYPLAVRPGERVKSLSPSESFELRQEQLPFAHPATFRDIARGWTLYRHFAATPDRAAFESACYHVYLQSMAPVDWEMLNYFNAFSPRAVFGSRLLVSQLLPDGNRKTLSYSTGDDKARFYLRDGQIGQIVQEEDCEPVIGDVAALLRRRFAYPGRPRTIARISSA